MVSYKNVFLSSIVHPPQLHLSSHAEVLSHVCTE